VTAFGFDLLRGSACGGARVDQMDDRTVGKAGLLGQADLAVLQRALIGGTPTGATVRERNRTPLDAGVRLLVEVFISRGQQGRILTWQINAQPKERSPDRYEITALRELAAFPLFKLVLDRSKPFAVRNLIFRAPDLTLKVVSGSAFVAESS